MRVPFGERVLTGVTLPDPAPAASASGVEREILEVLDAEPVCPPELLATAGRVAERFFASIGEVLKSALPARLPASGAVRYRVTDKGALGPPGESAEERAILERLASGEPVRVVDLPGEGRARREALRRLEESGRVRPVAAPRRPSRRLETAWAPTPLSPEDRERALSRMRRGRQVAGLPRLSRPRRHIGGDPRRHRRGRSRPQGAGGEGTAPVLRAGTPRRGPSCTGARARTHGLRPHRAADLGHRCHLRRDPRAPLLPGAPRGRHRQRQDGGLPQDDPRRARGRPRRDLARSRDRPDAGLRARARAAVPGARGRAPFGALGARARRGLGPGPRRRSARRDRPALRGLRPGARTPASSSSTRSTTPPTSSASRRGTTPARPSRSAPARTRPPSSSARPRRPIEAVHAAHRGRARAPHAARANRLAAAAGRRRSWTCAARSRGPTRRASRSSPRPLRRAPARDVRPRRAGDPPPAAPGVRALPAVPRLRSRLPLPNCSVARTVHDRGSRLVCHYCGERDAAPGALPRVRRWTCSRRSAPERSGSPSASRSSSRASRTSCSTATRPGGAARAAVIEDVQLGSRLLPHRHADGRQGPRFPRTSPRSASSRPTRCSSSRTFDPRRRRSSSSRRWPDGRDAGTRPARSTSRRFTRRTRRSCSRPGTTPSRFAAAGARVPPRVLLPALLRARRDPRLLGRPRPRRRGRARPRRRAPERR